MFVLIFFICLFVYLMLWVGNLIMSVWMMYNLKISFFEAGFDSVMLHQNSLSMHFFLILILFVIFDLELVIFLGFLMVNLYYLYFFVFFVFVLGSFYLEWLLGKLFWMV